MFVNSHFQFHLLFRGGQTRKMVVADFLPFPDCLGMCPDDPRGPLKERDSSLKGQVTEWLVARAPFTRWAIPAWFKHAGVSLCVCVCWIVPFSRWVQGETKGKPSIVGVLLFLTHLHDLPNRSLVASLSFPFKSRPGSDCRGGAT